MRTRRTFGFFFMRRSDSLFLTTADLMLKLGTTRSRIHPPASSGGRSKVGELGLRMELDPAVNISLSHPPSSLQAQLAWQLRVGCGRAGCPCLSPILPGETLDPDSFSLAHLSSPGLVHHFQCPSSSVCLESPLTLPGLAETSLPPESPPSGVHSMCRWVRLALAFLIPLQ